MTVVPDRAGAPAETPFRLTGSADSKNRLKSLEGGNSVSPTKVSKSKCEVD